MRKPFFLLLLICFSISVTTFAQSEKPFDFNKPFHALGFSVFNGISFAPKLQEHEGDITPILYPDYVPEFIVQYNYMIKNGLGIALEIPFGIFYRHSITPLSDYGASNDVRLEMGSPYIGFTAKLTVLEELSSKICMQGELGVKFHPFYYSADRWYNTNYYELVSSSEDRFYFEDNSSINFAVIEQKYYAIPDATAGLLFFFHSQKKPKNNLVLGVTANLSFVERIKVIYDTSFSELIEDPTNAHYSWGRYGWNSTAVGITVGYRFFGVK
jgi:hypothetical protein